MTPEQFANLITAARAKYDAGQTAHGGILTHRDCLAELEQELIDAWFYYQADIIHRHYPLITDPTVIRNQSLRRLDEVAAQLRSASTEDCIAPRCTPLEYHLFAALEYLVGLRARRAVEAKQIVP